LINHNVGPDYDIIHVHPKGPGIVPSGGSAEIYTSYLDYTPNKGKIIKKKPSSHMSSVNFKWHVEEMLDALPSKRPFFMDQQTGRERIIPCF